MRAVKDLPYFLIYFLSFVSISLLLLAIFYGGYHICYLGRNILTDDFHVHLVAQPHPEESPEQHPEVTTNEYGGHAHSLPEISVNERVPRAFPL
jgi:hypothetical protein